MDGFLDGEKDGQRGRELAGWLAGRPDKWMDG